jgi:hypothetical protein
MTTPLLDGTWNDHPLTELAVSKPVALTLGAVEALLVVAAIVVAWLVLSRLQDPEERAERNRPAR